MAFKATLAAFGSSFNDTIVTITEAGLEYRLNDHDGGTPENRLRYQYTVHVSQAAKDAGGEPLLNEWEESEADVGEDIADGDIKALAELKIKTLSKFSNIV